MSPKRLLKSFQDAGRGIAYVFKNEQNFRIQMVVGILVILTAILFEVSRSELLLLLLLVISHYLKVATRLSAHIQILLA